MRQNYDSERIGSISLRAVTLQQRKWVSNKISYITAGMQAQIVEVVLLYGVMVFPSLREYRVSEMDETTSMSA
jgi:hypothetical protein